MTQPNNERKSDNAVVERLQEWIDHKIGGGVVVPVRVLEAARDEIKEQSRIIANATKAVAERDTQFTEINVAFSALEVERDNLKAQLAAVMQTNVELRESLRSDVANECEYTDLKSSEIDRLMAERDQLAEKVASDAEDAEIGRLVVNAVARGYSVFSRKKIGGLVNGTHPIEVCRLGWPVGDTEAATKANLLEALQALSQGGEA